MTKAKAKAEVPVQDGDKVELADGSFGYSDAALSNPDHPLYKEARAAAGLTTTEDEMEAARADESRQPAGRYARTTSSIH